MKIFTIMPEGFGCNSYILTKDGKQAVVIDCAQPSVFGECIKRGLTPVAVLLTHGHFDHIGGCGEFVSNGVPVYCGEKETELIYGDGNMAKIAGVSIPSIKVSKTLKDGEELELCGIKIKVIATPGHTAGGVCYIIDDMIFSGDTLFYESVGRCDFPTGNGRLLIESVKKLFSLEGDYKVFCGHGEQTSLDHERNFNPYVDYKQ